MSGIIIDELKSEDIDEVVDCLVGDFCKREPLNVGLRIPDEENRNNLPDLVRKGVGSGLSYVARDDSGKIVGLKLCDVRNRQEEAQGNEVIGENTVDGDNEEEMMLDENCGDKILAVLMKLGKNTWSLVPPEVDKLYYIIIIWMSKDYARKGYGIKLLNHNIEEAKKTGCQGAIAEATAYRSQMMFAKLGYRVLHKIEYKSLVDTNGSPIIQCPDETTCAQLVYKDL